MPIRFRFRWIPFVVTVLLVALGVTLGQWQQRRAVEKMALEARLAAGNASAPLLITGAPLQPQQVEFRRVVVTGRFVPQWALYLDNRPYKGHAGFYLLMPFTIDGSKQHVLVARGWLPRNNLERTRLPEYSTPSGTVTIEGVARLSAGHVMQLGSATPLTPGAIVQNVTLPDLAAASGLALQPFIVEQGGAVPADEMLVRDWPPPSLGVDKHRGYAFQWYALALMALLFFVLTGFRRASK